MTIRTLIFVGGSAQYRDLFERVVDCGVDKRKVISRVVFGP